jgi:hypothetical protein
VTKAAKATHWSRKPLNEAIWADKFRDAKSFHNFVWSSHTAWAMQEATRSPDVWIALMPDGNQL